MTSSSTAPTRTQSDESTGRLGRLTVGTLLAATLGGMVAQIALATPAAFNGMFQADLHTTSSQLTWISDMFLLPITALELSFGVLGDLFGRKRLLVGGALLVALGELVSVLTPGAGSSTDARVAVLWVGQAITGIGAATLFPTALAMVAAGTRTAKERARGISIWVIALPLGGAISSVCGGLLAKMSFGGNSNASWRWALLMILAIAIVSAVVSKLFAADSSAPEGRSLDLFGQVTIALALVALLFAIIQSPTDGWGSVPVVVALLVAAGSFTAFVAAETRTAEPLLRLDLFANRAFSVTIVVTIVSMFCFLGSGYGASIRLSVIQGASPLRTALVMLPLVGFGVLVVPLNAYLLARYNPKWILGIGVWLMGGGAVWMSTIPSSDTGAGRVFLPLAMVGIGFGFAIASVTAVAVNTVPHHLAGMASGTTSMARDLGFTLGPALIGAIALSRAADSIHRQVASTPALQHAMQAFSQAATHAPPAARPALEGALAGINSGPLGAVSVPGQIRQGGKVVPFNPIHDVAFNALDNAYSLGFLILGICAFVAGTMAFTMLRGGRAQTEVEGQAGSA